MALFAIPLSNPHVSNTLEGLALLEEQAELFETNI